MCPSERRGVREQVQTCHAEVLPFGRAVTDFALASDAQTCPS